MSTQQKIPGTIEAWENGQLGEDARHVRPATQDVASAIDESLGLQMISIRLSKDLIETFKLLAKYHHVGYQPLMRDALKRFADAELKMILASLVDSKPPMGDCVNEKAAPSKSGGKKSPSAKGVVDGRKAA